MIELILQCQAMKRTLTSKNASLVLFSIREVWAIGKVFMASLFYR